MLKASQNMPVCGGGVIDSALVLHHWHTVNHVNQRSDEYRVVASWLWKWSRVCEWSKVMAATVLPVHVCGCFMTSQHVCVRWSLYSVWLDTAHVPGDHLSGKPGNVREFETCHGNVRDVVNSQGIVRGKSCHGKVSQNCSLLDEYLRSYGLLCT